MNKKERKQEEREIEQAVNVLVDAIRSVARRKAHNYEQELLCRVRNKIDLVIYDNQETHEYWAHCTSLDVEREIEKQ